MIILKISEQALRVDSSMYAYRDSGVEKSMWDGMDLKSLVCSYSSVHQKDFGNWSVHDLASIRSPVLRTPS